MRLTVLGCDGSYPGAGGACSGYLLRTEAASILLDAGTGTLANLQSHMDPQDLDAIVITHEHADHSANIHDLKVLYHVGARPLTGMPVYASPGVREAQFPRSDCGPQLDWHEIADRDELEIGDMTLRFSRTEHPVATHAVRVDASDRCLAYTADTGPEWSLDTFGSGINLAVCEAAFPAQFETPGHLSARQAGETAQKARAERLMLTHIRPQFDKLLMVEEAETTFNGPIELARIGLTVEV